MKKAICLLLISVLWRAVPAQVVIALLFGDKLNTNQLEFGIVVTPVWTNISNIDGQRRDGLDLGIYFNIHPEKRFFLHIEGIAKGALGAKGLKPYPLGSDTLDALFSTGLVERKIKAFSLPVLGRYAITPKFFAEAGIQPNMMLKTRDMFRSKVNGDELEYTVNSSDEITLLDFGVDAGLFYKFSKDKRSMGIGLRYFQGLTDMQKTYGTQLNSAWQLNITIPIGAGKVNANSSKNPGE